MPISYPTTNTTNMYLIFKNMQKKNPVYWIIDGIYGKESDPLVSEVFKLLPLSGEFKFLVTGEVDFSRYLDKTRSRVKVIDAISVSPDEARAYFSSASLPEQVVEEVRSFCRSNIGKMSIIRRLLRDQIPIDDLLKSTDGSLFSYEWELIDKDAGMIAVLSLLTFSNGTVSLARAQRMLGFNEGVLKRLVESSRFLFIDEDFDINISSRAAKTYLRNKLVSEETSTRNLIISELMAHGDSLEVAQNLPMELQLANRHKDLVELLDSDHFLRLLKEEKSLRSLKSNADLGVNSANAIDDKIKGASFAILASVVTGMQLSSGTRFKILALAALGRVDESIAVASMAPTMEERFQMLCCAADALKQAGHSIPVHVKDSIKSSFELLGDSLAGSSGMDTACDLVNVDPKIAFALMRTVVEKARCQDRESAKARSADSVLREDFDESKKNANSDFSIRPSESLDVVKFFNKSAKRFASLSPESILPIVRSNDSGYGMFVAKIWLRENRVAEPAFKVAEAALDSMLASIERTPLLEDLVAISVALPYIIDNDKRALLCTRIDSQHRMISSHGTSVESIRIRLQLHRAKYRAGDEEIQLSLIGIIYEITALEELSVKVTCWAWFIHIVSKFTDSDELENVTGVISDALNRMESAVEEVLSSTAGQFEATKEAILAMAKRDPRRAMKIVESLNTASSRSRGFMALANFLAGSRDFDEDVFCRCIRAIEEASDRDHSVVTCLFTILDRSDLSEISGSLKKVRNLWEATTVTTARAQAAALSMRLHSSSGDNDALNDINTSIIASWNQVPSEPVKLELGYWLAAEIAKTDSQGAARWMDLCAEMSTDDGSLSDSFITALCRLASMAIRVASRLSSSISLDSELFLRVSALLESISCCERRISLWVDLGVRLYFRDRPDLSKNILEKFVLPHIDSMTSDNSSVAEGLVIESFPLFFLVNNPSADRRLDALSRKSSDIGRIRAIDALLTRVPHKEPFTGGSGEYIIDRDVADHIVNLLSRVSHDSSIFRVCDDLCEAISSRDNVNRIRRNVASDILHRLDAVVSSRLPDSKNITHEGFLISCKASIFKALSIVNKSKPAESYSKWDDLYKRALLIQNVADRVIVVALVGTKAKFKDGSDGLKWLERVETDLASIPYAHDKADRYDWIARLVKTSDPALARRLILQAVDVTRSAPKSEEVFDLQRKVIDHAHAIDPDFSKDIINSFDNDPAKLEFFRQKDEANCAAKAIASKIDENSIRGLNGSQLSDISHKNLGSLNSGRINIRPASEFSVLLDHAQSMPIVRSYPIWSWFLENLVRKLDRSRSYVEVHKLLEAVLSAADIARKLAGGLTVPLSKGGAIKVGDRDLFVERVVEWASSVDGEVVRISDPYFSPDDMFLVKAILEVAPSSSFRISTSRKQVLSVGGDDAFLAAWRDLSDINPPEIEFSAIGFSDDDAHPIHDRWIVTRSSGLYLGSSINSIGYSRVSDVGVLGTTDALAKCDIIDKLFERSIRIFEGRPVRAIRFSL